MSTNENYDISYHQLTKEKQELSRETTLLVVLRGKFQLTVDEKTENLTPGELFVINAGAYYLLEPLLQTPCFYVEVRINSLYFASQFPAYFYTYFECSPKQKEHGKMHAIHALRRQIAELCLSELNEEPTKQLKTTLFLTQIILSLVHNFQREEEPGALHSDSQKLREIIEYIEKHYREGLSLADTAEYFFMSESSLSKFFKKETGDYFSHYVRSVAVKHSLTELLYTKKSIEQIALDVGFRNSKTYREHFKKTFGVSPTSYRSAHLAEATVAKHLPLKSQPENFNIKEILTPLYSYVQTVIEEAQASDLVLKTKQLHVSVEQELACCRKKELIIKIASLENLASKKVQQEILELNDELGIDYISIQSLFTQPPLTLQIHQEAGLNSFPAFEKLDSILAFLKQQNLRVFYQLSLPKFRKMGAYEREVYRKFFRHIQSCFGKNMLSNWKISCHFTQTEVAAYYAEFMEIKRLLQGQFSEIQLGAELPIADPFFKKSDLEAYRFFFEEIAPVCEFLSFSAEPNYVFQNLDTTFPDLNNYHQYVLNKTLYVKHIMKEFDVKLPLYLTEWNTLTGMTRISNGTFFRGAIILKDLLLLDPFLQGYGFWLNIDLYEENTQDPPLKNDGLELYHYYSGKRPAYFCLWLIRRLSGTIVSLGEEYLLTWEAGKYQLLLFNTNYFDPHLSTEEAFLQSHSLTIELVLSIGKTGNYQIKQIDFNRHNGALFYTYEEFRHAGALDLEAQQYINEKTRPKIKVFDAHVNDTFHYFMNLDTNGIVLLEFTPIYN
jgi:beta-xylosidase/AraC-like DNA-binding protein